MTERVTDITTFREFIREIKRLDKKATGDPSVFMSHQTSSVSEKFQKFFDIADGKPGWDI